MFITKKYLSRRTMLRSGGAMIALPFLDAMVPAATSLAKAASKPRVRLGFFYFSHGAVMGQWTPKTEGRDFELSPILAPMEKFRDQMTIISGLRNRAPDEAVSHGLVERTWLTCTPPSAIGAGDPEAGISADQIAARHIGQDTVFPSLELKTEEQGGTHSYASPDQPLPMEHNPRTLYYRLFGPGDSAKERDAILDETDSVLDRIQGQAGSLKKELGVSDRRRVDEYLDSVREVERRVQNMKSQDMSELEVPTAPLGVPDSLDEHFSLMFELLALAYQADLSRVATFQMAMEISMRAYTNLGISEAFHPLSHHSNDPTSLEKLAQIQAYHNEVFARFLDRLAEMPEGEGSVLDHSILLYGSNMSNSDKHNNTPLPLTIFGHGSGRVKGGQHVVYPEDTPLANLLLTMLQRSDVPVERLGDSTGTFAEI